MSIVYLDDLDGCLHCGDPIGGYGAARGLCGRCYRRFYRAGTVEQFPRRPTRAAQAAAEAEDLAELDVPELDLSWMSDALCAEVDSEIFFPEKGQSPRPAYSVCAECLVRAECLDYALTVGEPFGVWGGLSERKRRRLLGLPDDDVEDAA